MKKIHFTDRYLLNPRHPVTVFVIGAGGTGSQVITNLARMSMALQALGHPGLHVTVFDSVVNHFYIVACPIWTDIGHTWLAILWGFSRDFFQDIRHQFIGFLLATWHDRRSFKGSFFTTRDTCTDEVDTRVR